MAASERPFLAAALQPTDLSDARRALHFAADFADLAELRLDLMQERPPLGQLLGRPRCPVIVTLRSRAEGGMSDEPAAERMTVLRQAADAGAEYVDIEWDVATPEIVRSLQSAGARVIVSRHDFQAFPADDVFGWQDQIAAVGPDVVKLVGYAHEVRDSLRAFELFRRADRPTIAIAMGDAGIPSRVLAPREPHCFLTFGSLGADAVAPGQLSIEVLDRVYRARSLRASTMVYGVLAPRAEHKLVAYHNDKLRMAGRDAVVCPFVTMADAAEVIAAFEPLPVAGWHVHGAELQETVGLAMDQLAPGACHEGKVNSIVTQAGRLIGDWVSSPDEQLDRWLQAA